MQAFLITKYGDKKVASQEVPEPAVGPDDVLVDIKAASVNPLDVMVSNGEFKQLLKYKLPLNQRQVVSSICRVYYRW